MGQRPRHHAAPERTVRVTEPYYQDERVTVWAGETPEDRRRRQSRERTRRYRARKAGVEGVPWQPRPRGYKQSPEHIAKRAAKSRGETHPNWTGDQVSEKGGRKRALKLYPEIGPCQECGAAKSERHHIDGNTANNERANIAILCRRCHMAADGRLASVRARPYRGSKSA